VANLRALAVIVLILTGCGSPAASPSAPASATPGATATPAPSAVVTPTSGVTPAPTGTTQPTVAPSPVPTDAPPITPNTFVARGSMNHARRGTDPVLLLDGRVLAVGGETDADDVLDSAEVYDPATDTWTEVESMGDRRRYPVVVLLTDGRVLVAGGFGANNDALASAEIFDPTDNTFSPTAPMSVGRARFQGVRLDDGRVLVMGGNKSGNGGGGALDSAEIYDPASGTWSSTGSMHHAREAARAVKLEDGRVVITGGSDGGDPRISEDTTEMYNPDDGTFEEIGPMTAGRDRHAILLLGDGRVIVAGGEEDGDVLRATDVFDPLSGATIWTETAPLAYRRYAASYVTMANGNGLLCGGFDGGYLRTCEIYDAATDTWSETEKLAKATSGALMVLMPGGSVLICGGLGSGDKTLASCAMFVEARDLT
jgi:N-acetylneuraminic acid mutarotase